uniref:VP7 n=2 Tax=Liao ning virus TaxID=246280 RepID=A0A2P1N6P8_9REOV|nr:VP7 [Liao ning virus]
MDILSPNCGSVQKNCFQVYKSQNVYRVRFCVEGKVHDVPLPGVNTHRDIIGTVKYFCELMGLNIVDNSLRLNWLNLSDMKNHGDNVTLAKVGSEYGDLFVKKLPTLPINIHSTNYVFGKYSVFARVHGIVKLLNDDNYDVGVILEKCNEIRVMTVNIIVMGLKSLMDSHRESGGTLHGDCTVQNLMCDKFGMLKLVDPGNLMSQTVIWKNDTQYFGNTVDDEVCSFVMACLKTTANLRNIETSELTIPFITDLYLLDIVLSDPNVIHGTKESGWLEVGSDFVSIVQMFVALANLVRPYNLDDVVSALRTQVNGEHETFSNVLEKHEDAEHPDSDLD